MKTLIALCLLCSLLSFDDVLAARPQMPAQYMLDEDRPAGPLHAPPGYYQPVTGTRGADFTCPSLLPPYTGSLVFPSKYAGSDRARDVINPAASAEYERLTGTLRTFEKTVSGLADRFAVTGGDPRILECFLNQVASWAEAQALLDRECNEIGMASRKWLLAATASAWLQVSLAAPEQMARYRQQVDRVETWFTKLAAAVQEDYSGRDLKHINNHDYWAGWAVMATAVVLDRRDLFVWAFNRLRIAVNEQATADGFLPNELRRRTRALLYHNYAMGPLTMILVFAEANDIHLSDTEAAGFRRLADRVVEGIGRPSVFADVTGSPQELDGLREPYSLAWLLPYGTVFQADEAMRRLISGYDRMVSTRLGGNLTRLYGPFRLNTPPSS
ncbi:MAG TPA: mannuronate-specific alginate lyase [Desulfobulbus sp.]|nr:mannuronate-specific alginate lyase [Desulfobulbus sp.]